MRLIDVTQVQWRDRLHFFAIASQLMRRVLVDTARSRAYAKRGAGLCFVSFNEGIVAVPDRSTEFCAAGRCPERAGEPGSARTICR